MLVRATLAAGIVLALAGAPLPTEAQSLKFEFTGSYETRYGNPFDPGSYETHSTPVSGWFTYEQSAHPTYSDYASSTYNGAITSFSFTSTEFEPFYGTDTVSSYGFPEFISSIAIQGGPYPGMATFNIRPDSYKLLQVLTIFPSSYFSTTSLPGPGVSYSDTSTEYRPGTFYGLACTQFAPCGPAGEGVVNGFTISSGMAPPTDKELAQLSFSAYGNVNETRFSEVMSTPAGEGLTAIAYKNGDQIVVAFGGTEPKTLSGLKDFLADQSFYIGIPSFAMEIYASKAAEFLAAVEKQYGTSNITLTGHSLGGAIAELLGNASKFRAVAFDAPGPAKLVSALQDEISVVDGLSGRPATEIINYRLWGDAVSLVGDQLGDTKTVHPLDGNLPDQVSALEALHDHGMKILADAMKMNTAIENDIKGPKLEHIKILGGALVIGGNILLHFADYADELAELLFDPPPAGGYLFAVDEGSPFLHSLQLPNFNGISSFVVSAYGPNGWGAETSLTSLSWFYFDEGATGFSVYGLDSLGRRANFSEAILFDLRFRTSGNFAASVEALAPVPSVPEPQTWALMLAGLFLAGMQLRMRSRAVSGVIRQPRRQRATL
ncbi:PEP-CTERM sorting domain-containing protein [Sphingomonas sp.]|uniref:lipase family protein n=1 Tax=Sphingomonas sp. TaxID=28214 RepID=UPI001B177D4F|nr:PEP-CTERM sorting domain-containing protein [Sphingomonas sp.]MBO9714248.1 alpha/beta hydrolase [Sphingomonas sp.]